MKKIIYLITSFLCVGCSTLPERVSLPVKHNEIAALVYIADQKPRHTHAGSTVFHNFERLSVGSVNYDDHILQEIENILSQNTTLEVKKLPPSTIGFNVEDKDIFNAWTGDIDDDYKAKIQRAALEHGFDYLFIISQSTYPAWPNSLVSLDGFGVYSRCFFEACTYEALDQLSLYTYSVKEQSRIGSFPYKMYDRPQLNDLRTPRDPESVNDDYVKAATDKAIEKFIRLVDRYLEEIGIKESS